MEDSKQAVEGIITKVDKYYADIQVSGLIGSGHLDVSVARRVIGSYVGEVRDILQSGGRLLVRVEPMKAETLSKIPAQFAHKYKWEVKFFSKIVERIQQPGQYNTPAKYLADSSRRSALPREYEGRIISALLQITQIMDDTSVYTLTPLVKTHFKVKDIPDKDLYLPDAAALQRFVASLPQYFRIIGNNVRRLAGFTEELFDATVTKKANEIRPSTARGVRMVRPAAAPSADTADFADVIAKTRVIDSDVESKRVLNTILTQSQLTKVIVGLDCEGVNLGRENGALTLVQVSTVEGKSFLFDVFKNPRLLAEGSSLKKLLEDNNILKVIHDCKSDTTALYHEFKVTLRNIFDTSIAMRTVMEQLNRERSYRISFKNLCEVLGEPVNHKEDDFVKKMVETPDFWKIRPLTREMIYYSSSDALCLVPSVYEKLDGMLNPLWKELFTWSCEDTMKNIQRPRGAPRGQTQGQRGRRGAPTGGPRSGRGGGRGRSSRGQRRGDFVW